MPLRKATVLAVDDDENLQTVVQTYLEQQGCKVITAYSGAEMMDKLKSMQPDIILLDLVLPDQDGLDLLTMLRQQSKAPVIVVSGKDEATDRIVGLEMGADDYLTKPFEMRELSARIRAVLRRVAPAEQQQTKPAEGAAANQLTKAERLGFQGWVLDRRQYQLFDASGEPADLTSGEFKLLEALALAPNRVLTREQLFELTRQGNFEVYDRAIDIQIARIRKKIDDDPKQPTLIKTVRGAGYMFCGEVKAVA